MEVNVLIIVSEEVLLLCLKKVIEIAKKMANPMAERDRFEMPRIVPIARPVKVECPIASEKNAI